MHVMVCTKCSCCWNWVHDFSQIQERTIGLQHSRYEDILKVLPKCAYVLAKMNPFYNGIQIQSEVM